MLASELPGAKVLDAFAGSGALGIEALSRGAESIVFVEKSPAAARIIKKNLDKLSLGSSAEVVIDDVEKYQSDKLFDIILADPPYDNFDAVKIQNLVGFLSDDGILILSHPGDAPILNDINFQKTNTYAGAKISIYYK